LERIVKDLIQQLKDHEYTNKAIAYYKKALKHKYVVEAKAKLEKLIKMAQDKIEEIKAHPTTKKYTKLAQKKLNELKKEVKTMEKKLRKLKRSPSQGSNQDFETNPKKLEIYLRKVVPKNYPTSSTC